MNLKIQYLQKEVEVQSRIIKQWKALYESSQVKPTRECHVNCKIDHSKYNYIARSIQPRKLDAQNSLDVKNENWYMIKAARAVDKLQDIYGVPQPPPVVKMESMHLLYSEFTDLWENVFSFQHNLLLQNLVANSTQCSFVAKNSSQQKPTKLPYNAAYLSLMKPSKVKVIHHDHYYPVPVDANEMYWDNYDTTNFKEEEEDIDEKLTIDQYWLALAGASGGNGGGSAAASAGDLDKHVTEEYPDTRCFEDDVGDLVCVKDEFDTYDLDDFEDYTDIDNYWLNHINKECGDEEEVMDLVTRKYAPSTLPYPLLFSGGSSDEEADDVEDARIYNDSITADIKQEDPLNLDDEARYFVDAYNDANFMLDYQPENSVSDDPRFGYTNGGEDDGYKDYDHGTCYAYEDEADDHGLQVDDNGMAGKDVDDGEVEVADSSYPGSHWDYYTALSYAAWAVRR